MSNAESLRVCAPLPSFVRGDADSNGSVNLSDAVATLLHLIGGLRVECFDELVADDSGTVNLKDEVRVLDCLFHSGPPSAVPFLFPGAGPTVEGFLDCANGGA